MLKTKLIKSIIVGSIALTTIASIFPTMSVNAMTKYVDYGGEWTVESTFYEFKPSYYSALLHYTRGHRTTAMRNGRYGYSSWVTDGWSNAYAPGSWEKTKSVNAWYSFNPR